MYSGLERPYLFERKDQVKVDGPYSVTLCCFLAHVKCLIRLIILVGHFYLSGMW